MGARAQVKIEDTGVYLYTHWGSGELKDVLKYILSSDPAQARLKDPEYLGRIIFEGMIQGAVDRETGYGIGTVRHTDLDYPPIIINCMDGTVVSEDGLQTIQEFINA